MVLACAPNRLSLVAATCTPLERLAMGSKLCLPYTLLTVSTGHSFSPRARRTKESTMQNTNVLISGASVAGPALAYWLGRYGFQPTVVEEAPALRGGGYAVDFRGPA